MPNKNRNKKTKEAMSSHQEVLKKSDDNAASTPKTAGGSGEKRESDLIGLEEVGDYT